MKPENKIKIILNVSNVYIFMSIGILSVPGFLTVALLRFLLNHDDNNVVLPWPGVQSLLVIMLRAAYLIASLSRAI